MIHIIEPRPLGYCPARNVSTMLVHQVHVISRHITATDIVSTILAITEIRSAFQQTMSSTLYQLGHDFIDKNFKSVHCATITKLLDRHTPSLTTSRSVSILNRYFASHQTSLITMAITIAIRDGWIFRKLPKGGGAVHFQSQNYLWCCDHKPQLSLWLETASVVIIVKTTMVLMIFF